MTIHAFSTPQLTLPRDPQPDFVINTIKVEPTFPSTNYCPNHSHVTTNANASELELRDIESPLVESVSDASGSNIQTSLEQTDESAIQRGGRT
ncbi:hypothetical protein E4T56_gene19802 [Termitomyces sp. T112]|nr:hypothetical protein E4T56_gene19802 [Termitomyces sp. T112]